MKLRKRTLRFVADKNTDDKSVSGTRRSTPKLRRRAAEIMNYRLMRKLILIGITIGAAVLMIGYSVTLLYNRTGRFSVAINNPSEMFAITLSERPDFTVRTARLTNDQEVTMTNICGDVLTPAVNEEDGQHNGENFLAYTFYCKNVGKVDTDMQYELTYNNVENHVDEAIRVRIYVDGEFTDYAKTRSDGTGKETHYCDYAFEGKTLVCSRRIHNVHPNDYVKFTVVIWLEGDDEDCNDSVINGMAKFDMVIEAKGPTEVA